MDNDHILLPEPSRLMHTLEGQLDSQSTSQKTLAANTTPDVLAEFASAAVYSAVEEPVRGAAQLVDQVFSTRLDSYVRMGSALSRINGWD